MASKDDDDDLHGKQGGGNEVGVQGLTPAEPKTATHTPRHATAMHPTSPRPHHTPQMHTVAAATRTHARPSYAQPTRAVHTAACSPLVIIASSAIASQFGALALYHVRLPLPATDVLTHAGTCHKGRYEDDVGMP